MRAGITFPIGRCGRKLRGGKYTQRTGKGAAIGIAAVMEYLVAEIMEVAGETCKDMKKIRIVPRHIELAVRNDSELGRMFSKTSFANAGVTPYINPVILAKHKSKKWLIMIKFS